MFMCVKMTRTDFWVVENIDIIQSWYGLVLVGGPSGSPYGHSLDVFYYFLMSFHDQ